MRQRLSQNLTVIGISILVALLLSEMALRILLPPVPSGWGWEDSPLRPPDTNQKDDPSNELGLRGQKISYGDDDLVVLLLGDSQVEAATSLPENMPERLLEKYLRTFTGKSVKVFSLASSGWGQDQEFLALEEYYKKKYRADLVLVWATPNNDFWENAFPDRSVFDTAGHLKPTYRLAAKGLSGPFYKPGAYYGHSALLQLIAASFLRTRGEDIEQHVLFSWMKDLPPARGVEGTQGSSVCANTSGIDQDVFFANIFTLNADAHFTILTGEDFLNSRSHFSPYGLPRSPRDNYLIEITRKLFENIEHTARSHGANFFVFSPIRDIDHRVGKQIECVTMRAMPGRTYQVDLTPSSILKEVIPAEELIPFELPGGNELQVSPGDVHLNVIGNDKAMKEVAALITQRGS